MKASGSYASLVHGVSEQVPQERKPGQLTEQVNLIADPVTGLTRRHGTRFQAEKALGYDPALIADITADTDNWRTIAYNNAGNDFVVMIRNAAKPTDSPLPLVIVFNRTTGEFLDYVRPDTDTFLDAVEAGGVSAATAIGRIVFMAGNTTTATASTNDLWGATVNQESAAVWVRGGAFNRTYTVTATKTDGTLVTFTYTTPTAAYTGTLDTTGVPIWTADPAGGTQADTESLYIDATGTAVLYYGTWQTTLLTAKNGTTTMSNVHPSTPTGTTQFSWATGDTMVKFDPTMQNNPNVVVTYTHTKVVTNPSYSYIVGQLTSDYNTQVSQWIVSSAIAIEPNNIAESLRLAAVAAGLTSAARLDGTIHFDNVKGLTVDDGGDGTLIRGVANEITSVDQVSDIHLIGKIVRVRARNSADVFYLKAIPYDSSVTTGWAKVTWVEGAGVEYNVTAGMLFCTALGSSFYVASSSALLNSIVTLTPVAPDYVASTCGDAASSPLPFFIGKQISYLGVFQDRLLIGSGAVLRCSKTGDYLNFFRSSVLTVPADDPIEMLSQGSEDDTLRYSVIYDRDLVIFGIKRQYAVSGRATLSPTNASMQVMSQHENAADTPPLAQGSLIFYGQIGETDSSVHQIQPGIVADQPESYIVSSQIATYLTGSVIELSNNAKPTHLFARTTGARNSVFVFTYLDKDQEGRVQDAWNRWDFDPGLGPIIGMTPTKDGLLVFRMQTGLKYDGSGSDTWIVADLCPLTTGLSIYPYLDSLRPWADVEGSHGSVFPTRQGNWKSAFDTSSEFQYVGGDLADTASLLTDFPDATGPYVGMLYDAYFIPTNPFVKDRLDNAITTGRLVVTSLRATFAGTSGFQSDITANEAVTTQQYNGRVLGDIDNKVGIEPVTDSLQSFPIGKETREYSFKLSARDWFPFTITALEWVGQFFNRTQRF